MTGSSPEDDEVDEATWQAIIEGLGPLTVPPADPHPSDASPSSSPSSSNEVDEQQDTPPLTGASSWRAPAGESRGLSEIFDDSHLGFASEDSEGEDFIPPDPPPVLSGDPLLTLAWFATLGGAAIWLVMAIIWTTAPGWMFWIGTASFLLGVAVLLWRLPDSKDPDDFDDGARV